MQENINRRRFVTLTGAASVVGLAGCVGGGEESDQPSNSDGNGEQSSDDDGEQEPEEEPEAFDFPPGAKENGIVMETVLAGSRQFVDKQDRYRTTQTYELDYSNAPTDEISITYDADEQLVHEQETRNGVEINRWVTPERTVAQSVDPDADRTNRWQTQTPEATVSAGNTFNRYPFEETIIPSLLQSASFEFEEIVTESEQAYARYTGEINRAETPELRQPDSARVDYRLESISRGSVSMLLAESGAVRSVEYEFAGEGNRLTYDGPEEMEIEVTGELDFEFDEELEALTAPEWVETPDSDTTRRFETKETNIGGTYIFASGQPLPGSVKQEYTEFYITAQFGSERYIARYRPRRGFEVRDRVVAWRDNNGLHLDWTSFSGQDAFLEADRIELSIYLYAPSKGRSLIYHDEYTP